jgi:hypothetical protein
LKRGKIVNTQVEFSPFLNMSKFSPNFFHIQISYLCSNQEQFVGNVAHLEEHNTQCHAREYVRVVALAGHESTATRQFNWRKWTARSVQRGALFGRNF